MSTLSLDSAVSLFEPAARRAPLPLSPAPAPAPPRASRRAERDDLGGRHGRRAQPRGRRASGSTLGAAMLLRSLGLVAVRVLGTGAAAAAVTAALAAKASPGTPGTALLASLSVRGLAFAAILCAAWGFQDRPVHGARATRRAWYGAAAVLAGTHAAWFEATLPGAWRAHLGITLATFALDVVLVAAPALLGARAGRPELSPDLPAAGV